MLSSEGEIWSNLWIGEVEEPRLKTRRLKPGFDFVSLK